MGEWMTDTSGYSVQLSTPKRIAFGLTAAGLAAGSLWSLHDITLALLGQPNIMGWGVEESPTTLFLMALMFAWLAAISCLYVRRMVSRHPFAVIREDGVECWKLHKRVRVPWPPTPVISVYRGEMTMMDAARDEATVKILLKVLLPSGGESVKLRDAACVQSVEGVANVIKARCPRPVSWA